MSGHQAGIFSEVSGGGSWGWQCFTCYEEEGGFGTAKAAQEAAIHHRAAPCGNIPAWTDLFGIDPTFTGGRDVSEWLDEQRGEA